MPILIHLRFNSFHLSLIPHRSYGRWIYNYLYNQFPTSLKLQVQIPLMTRSCTQSRKLGIWIHRTFSPVNCEELQDRTRFYRTDNKIMIFFLNNKYILFKCHILISLNLQSQTAISTIRQLNAAYLTEKQKIPIV
jgi:hypothetical protein